MFISLCRALCKPYFPKKTSKLRFRNCPIRSNPPFQMPINLQNHVFAGNPLKSKNSTTREKSSSSSTIQSLRKMISGEADEEYLSNLKVLPFRKGRPLTCSSSTGEDSTPVWKLGFVNWVDLKGVLGVSEEKFSEDLFVYLGSDHELSVSYWAMDASSGEFGVELGNGLHCFVELRTLMVAADWTDEHAMGELALAGQAKALLEWHNTVRFCGFCGESTMPIDAGRRKQCSNELCKKRIYPRVDPVVIMLVIDKANDRALLSRQSRYVPRMWSCLAGFLEPGESLEEAVRRETWEETGVEVGEVIYHSSQPWPVGPNSMPCQLMVGFIAYAKTFEIHVDKNELEDAQWHSREDVKKSLILAEYDKAQKKAAIKVEQMCKGSVEKDLNISNVESGDLAPIFIPGPYAIAHHLISSWVNQDMHPTKLFSEQNVSSNL